MDKKRKKLIIIVSSVGESMYPLIINGNKLYIKVSEKPNYQVGDIIAYIRDGQLIAHRLIKITKDAGKTNYLFKGDNNPGIDSYVKKQAIIGKVEKVISGRSIINLTNRRNTFLKYFMLAYSFLNLRHPIFFHLNKLYKVPIIKSIYSLIVDN